ncbi:uncharacterized protein LOC133302681 [Gastrolobium bilobum]|uniref:uncharacterized protein LOC133302681 n=1 Tax=Gastrolobium bilobum TaxID=150636 RepID=UPI002AB2E551|nr:uncharacterized protein LOC133302681 [Gastrolobium bilobum]
MANSSPLKRIKMAPIKVETFSSLPSDLLTRIFGKVASHSLEDIVHVKLTCKDFLQIAKTDYVYEQVSLDKFALGPLECVTDAKPFLHRVRAVHSDSENVDGPDVDYLDPERMYKINRQVYFLQRCRGSGNPEVLYREGVVNYFRESSGPTMQQKALENLKIAAMKG